MENQRYVLLMNGRAYNKIDENSGCLSAQEAGQLWVAGQRIGRYYRINTVFHEGDIATDECTRLVVAAVRPNTISRVHEGLCHKPIFQAAGLGIGEFYEEVRALGSEKARLEQSRGGTRLMVADACQRSRFAEKGRAAMVATVLDIAAQIGAGRFALGITRESMAELAAFDPAHMPFGIGEGSTVVYTVAEGKIVRDELLWVPER